MGKRTPAERLDLLLLRLGRRLDRLEQQTRGHRRELEVQLKRIAQLQMQVDEIEARQKIDGLASLTSLPPRRP